MGQLPQIPGYKLLKVLKQSKRSRTFLAEQQSLARQVALKVLSEEFFDDPALRQRFVDEGKSAARLNHPHVLAVFDIGSAGGFPFIATEFVPGGTLRERMQQPMAPVDALRIARDLASALDYAHSQGVIHRDIKPSNIMFRGDGAAVLGDLGILKAQSGSGSMQIGSPHYMSPEQIEGDVGDGRADLYSLGTVLYEMLTGKPPFDADDPFAVIAKHLTDPVPKLPEALSLYQPLIDRTLAKRPEERYSGAREMVNAIDGYIEPNTVREPRSEQLRSSGPTRPTRPLEPVSAATQPVGAATVMQPAVTPDAAPPPRAKPQPQVQSRTPAGKNNPVKAFVRIGILLLVIVGIVWGISKLLAGGKTAPAPAPAASSQLSGTKDLTAIESDLKAAERLIAAKKYFAPPGDNAYEHLAKARAMKDTADRAAELTRLLVESVVAQVRELRAKGDKAGADALLKLALTQFPDEPALKALR